MDQQPVRLLVASASKIRRQLLHAVGLSFTSCPAKLDEEEEKKFLLAQGFSLPDLALALATKKAASVSEPNKNSLVVGFDQVMIFNQQLLDKPKSMDLCRHQLLAIRGSTCSFACAAVVFLDGKQVWSFLDQPTVKFANFSSEVVAAYLQERGKEVCLSPAGCQIEGLGLQLIEEISGSYYSILGVPLLPLLACLRKYGLAYQWQEKEK